MTVHRHAKIAGCWMKEIELIILVKVSGGDRWVFSNVRKPRWLAEYDYYLVIEKHAEIAMAFLNGKTIQVFRGKSWVLCKVPLFDEFSEYRELPPEQERADIDSWIAEYAMLFIRQTHTPLEDALENAQAQYENIGGDIENNSPQDAVSEEIDAMRTDL